jgi:multiple sugar transport system substrate-binding protein
VEVGNSRRVRFASAALATGLLAATLAGCSGGGSAGGDTAASADLGAATGTIKVWAQQGQEGEVKAIQDQVAAFNKAQSDVKVELQLLPQGTYDQTLQTTKAADLPDAFEFGGETMAALVYAGKLREVTGAVTQATLDSEISSVVAQNTYPGDGKQYAVSQYDSGLALFGNKKLLDDAGVSYPTTIDQAWTFQQFADAVKALAAKDKDGKSLSIEENYAGQWPGYAFTPIVNSAGFPLVGADGKSVGNLNAPAVATALTDFAALREYTDANADDLAFQKSRVGLVWVGHWMYNTYADALGEDLVVIPLPNWGNGTKSGQGSHSWAISSTSKSAAAAGKFLDWVMADAAVKQVTDSNGAPPGTTSVTASSKLYAPGGALQLYADQLAKSCGSNPPTPDCVTVPRTISAAWPVINDTFSKAFWAIWQGGDAQAELDKAAKAIDLDYTDNDGYK